MDHSFELLSSMSPKTKGRQKTLKKAIKVLALKKHIRRSSIYGKVPSTCNQDVDLVEPSTDSSEYSSNIQKKILKNIHKSVVIIDSTDSENEEELPRPKKLSVEMLKMCDTNTKDPKVRVQEWLNEINLDEKKDDLTFFSQVSTIYGDTAPKFDPDSNGLAACSTFNEYLTKRFDELFIVNNGAKKDLLSDDSLDLKLNTSLKSRLKKNSQPKNKIGSSKDNDLKNLVIDETLLTSDESIIQQSSPIFPPKNQTPEQPLQVTKENSQPKNQLSQSKENDFKNMVIDETLLTSDESIVQQSSPKVLPKTQTPEQPLQVSEFITTRKKNVKFVNQLENSPDNESKEMETLLDSLYGEKWREKQSHVLPLSEPRRKQTSNNQKKAPNTERAKKPSIKGSLLPTTKKLNFNQLKTPIASPWVQQLRGLVNSDSDGGPELDVKEKGLENVKTRLEFGDESPLAESNNRFSKTVKQIKNNKINFDDSPLEESLEERIRKKMNNFKTPTTSKTLSKKGKNKTSNKENNPITENKNKTSNKENNHNTENKNKGQQKRKETKETFLADNTQTNSKKIIGIETDNKLRSKSSSSSHSCDEIEISSDEEYDNEITKMLEVKRKSFRPSSKDGYSFLESLSGCVPLNKCDMSARVFRSSFKQYRDQLTSKLFKLYNEKVFDNAIPTDTELEWNDKLRNTAGLCYCKKLTHKDGKVERKVRIALSSKVLDSADRLRDTLIHEMCHAGTWIINEISNGHGIYWKNWAFRAMKVFPELPPIKRCHSYTINTKYTYKCVKCGYSVGRHTKSLDLQRKRCGLCYGEFELLINKTSKSGQTKSVPVTPRKEATGFALFVKENYAKFKEPTKTHGDVMKTLGQKFSELKVKNIV